MLGSAWGLEGRASTSHIVVSRLWNIGTVQIHLGLLEPGFSLGLYHMLPIALCTPETGALQSPGGGGPWVRSLGQGHLVASCTYLMLICTVLHRKGKKTQDPRWAMGAVPGLEDPLVLPMDIVLSILPQAQSPQGPVLPSGGCSQLGRPLMPTLEMRDQPPEGTGQLLLALPPLPEVLMPKLRHSGTTCCPFPGSQCRDWQTVVLQDEG